MKVGIITFHRALNYGALLQTYALQKVLENNDVDVQVIDYRNSIIENMYYYKSFSERRTIKEKVKYLLQAKEELAKRDRFEEFRTNKLRLTKKPYINDSDLSEISDYFDYYITGSDQVWNYRAHKFDKSYFLKFVSQNKKKKSYAASFGISTLESEYVDEYRSALADFEICSVREKEGVQIVEETLGLRARVDIDPTLLLTKEQWKSESSYLHEENYILLYCFELTPSMKKFTEELSAGTGLEVRYFGQSFRSPLKVKCKGIKNAGPLEFVKSFIEAKYVVTNSFHGAAFSINLNKEFFVELLVKGKDVNSRIRNIIRLTGLGHRYIVENKALQDYEEINWSEVNRILDNERLKSIMYLRRTICKEDPGVGVIDN